MTFTAEAERVRRDLLSPLKLRLYLWWRLPLAAGAGLRLDRLDEARCEVSLPGGWRTQNPFRSMYFAAQAMAAELSTGAPALTLATGSHASISTLVLGLRAEFLKKAVGRCTFAFEDVAGMAQAIERAALGPDPVTFLARSRGRMGDGAVVAVFDITWTFKRR
ncbi:MAG TPA: DUF4442 domain-containing protein [Vicinamibacteria bacterium]|nr:DUF4442 domain-containing protein [Vicinamibacteria bacterium]